MPSGDDAAVRLVSARRAPGLRRPESGLVDGLVATRCCSVGESVRDSVAAGLRRAGEYRPGDAALRKEGCGLENRAPVYVSPESAVMELVGKTVFRGDLYDDEPYPPTVTEISLSRCDGRACADSPPELRQPADVRWHATPLRRRRGAGKRTEPRLGERYGEW